MADLRSNFIGIKSPNPFWLASAPPTDKEYNVRRAFQAGWGGVVWKTLGSEGPPVVNVNGPRYGVIHGADRRVLGINNIELITDRPLEVNLREIKSVKRDYPDRALIISLMVPCDEDSWRDILAKIEDTGADGVELNFGCPHGMAERGMGSAVGQVPEYIEMVTRWVKQYSRMPCIVKLTPNITDVTKPAEAARRGGADAVSLINTINSITSVDLDLFAPQPTIDGKGSHGGYCGPAVKPIALNMVAEIARNPATAGLPISGIGGVTTWRDAAEFMALGAGNVQVCTAAMTYGFKVVQEMITGLHDYLDSHEMGLSDLIGRAVDERSSLVLDLGGGEAILRDYNEDTSLVEFCDEVGMESVGLFMCGADPADFGSPSCEIVDHFPRSGACQLEPELVASALFRGLVRAISRMLTRALRRKCARSSAG